MEGNIGGGSSSGSSMLQQEVNSLKSRVVELEGKISDGTSSGSSIGGAYAFEVDGIHFNMGGSYCDPVDYYQYTSSYGIIGGVRTDYNTYVNNGTYTYDSYGRIASHTMELETTTNITQYSYSPKTVTITYKTIYKEPSSGGVSETGNTVVTRLK